LGVERPWTRGPRLSLPRWEHLGEGEHDPPILLHQGFLIDSNAIWRKSGVIQRLAADRRAVVLLLEHSLREAGEAHALGHDSALLLAETLADVLDGVGADQIDLVAASDGVAGALVLAMNDDRVRRLVLVDPFDDHLDPVTGFRPTSRLEGPTLIELELGITCQHGQFEAREPLAGLRLELGWIMAPTKVVTNDDHLEAAKALVEFLPRASLSHFQDDTAPSLYDPRCPGTLSRFLSDGAT
jgi:pimeloyl-ACP methyl ester carboxylesterase